MADDRSWEREYCRDRWYRAPTDEERAKLQVHRTCSAAAVVVVSAALWLTVQLSSLVAFTMIS